eukprot:11096437-Ditylum_brightwellii.AAC.1
MPSSSRHVEICRKAHCPGGIGCNHCWAIVMDSLVEGWEDVSLLVPSLEKAGVELVDGGVYVCSFRAQGEDLINLTIYNASQYTWWVCQVGRDT